MARRGLPNKFLTLTVLDTIGDSPAHRRDLLHTAWRNLIKRIKRYYRYKKLPYMAFIERTKRGEPHLHILLRCGWLDQAWLSNQMRDLVGSPIVDIRAVKSTRQAVSYVTKYVGKEPAQFGTRKRYWLSQDYIVEAMPKLDRPPIERSVCRSHREDWRGLIDERTRGHWTWTVSEMGWYRFFRPTGTDDAFGLVGSHHE